MDDDYATDADLALSRKRGVERLIDSSKLQDAILTDGRDSPTKRVCLRQMENAIKPDTPAIPSIRSRLVVLDRQLSAANDENTDKTPQPNVSLAAKSAAQEVRMSQTVGSASRISEFASENWEEVDVPNLRRIKKLVDPALQPVSERMAGWQKKVDTSSTSAEKGLPLSDRRKTAWEGKACGSEEKNSVRSRLSMWEQKVSEEQEKAATPVVAPRGTHGEREAGIREGPEGKAELDVVYVRNVEKCVSHEVAAAPRTLSSAVPPLVTPPTPAARTSIYHLIKKPTPATSFAPSAPTPSARPAPIVALVAKAECKDGETSGRMALDMTAPSTDAKVSGSSTAPEENGIVAKCVETDMLNRREVHTTEEAQSNITEIVTLGNAEPQAESIQPPETVAPEEFISEVVTCSIPAVHDIVQPRHETVSESHLAGATDTTPSSQEPHALSPQSATAFESFSATPNPSFVDSEMESSGTPLPFNVSLLRRPRDARETPSARQIKQGAPRPFSYESLLEDREEEERSLYNKRATYAADVVDKSSDRYERSQSVDDSLNRFKVALPIDLGSIVRQNTPSRGERIGLSDEITVRKSIVEQLKVLQEAVIREQNIILQTSNALSKCCHSNSAFAGSVEAVECHRLLLISTKKKETYQRTIHALKVGGSSEGSTNEVTGKFTVSNVSMPFKQEFISKLTVGEPSVVHHFIVMIRCGKTVHFSPIVSTQDAVRGFLEVPGPFHFNDIDQNFELEIEVYGLSVARDVGTPKKKKLLTPKKKLLGAKSVGGHNELSVPSFFRASNFQLMGLIMITMPMVNRNQFSLEKVAQSSPLQGTINLKMVCLMETNIIERGFLTMFEDVNGFGAWHRRWCLLKDNVVSYWKYPDDEKSKEPIGSIDLKICTTDVIGPIPRDICARPNTFELVTARRQKQGETDTLVSKCINTVTTTKLWLSADTKEERIIWCEKFNEVVHNLRLWHPDFVSGGRSSSSSSQDSHI